VAFQSASYLLGWVLYWICIGAALFWLLIWVSRFFMDFPPLPFAYHLLILWLLALLLYGLGRTFRRILSREQSVNEALDWIAKWMRNQSLPDQRPEIPV
jgi:membrane protein implicated in regulation of membrane protease activity